MTKFAAFSFLLIVLEISSIYKVNSAPQYPLYPEYPTPAGPLGGFRALGVNYYHMYVIFHILAAMLCSINRSITNINGKKY